MFKLIFTLAVALYGSFLIWGQPGRNVTEVAAQTETSTVGQSDAAGPDYDRPVILTPRTNAIRPTGRSPRRGPP